MTVKQDPVNDAETVLIQDAHGLLPWGSEVRRNRKLVSLPDRVVFDAETADGVAVVVKANWGAGRRAIGDVELLAALESAR